MIEAVLDQLVQTVSAAYGDEIEAARKDFFRRCGEPFQDEPSYELRLRNFIEWYVFDRPLAVGLTPFEAFMADPAQSAELKQAFLPFRDQDHSLFEVAAVNPGRLTLVDLWTGRKLEVEVEVTAGYDAGAVVEARLVVLGGRRYATNTHLYHTPGSAKFIRKMAKLLRSRRLVAGWTPFLWRTNYLQLKAERYKHVDSDMIYREILGDVKEVKQRVA
jgi:hypothetical protein